MNYLSPLFASTILGILLVTNAVQAKTYTTSDVKPVIVTEGSIGKRVCYYEDKAYSIGAVLKIDSVIIQCAPEKDFELNGALKWVVFESNH
ncbi:YnjH family protein [Vibrio rotiferianus]|jgi:hypothetical protein|uniref:YnjH family protein n=1 Tax=Vibrio rotiferianus TaxID=190895 RepID=UPI00406AA3C0